MLAFKTIIKKFDKKGEKTGWTYIEIRKREAEKINPGKRVSYRIKGFLDNHPIQKVAILPMGDGSFILPLNAVMRKAIQKKVGDSLNLKLELDERPLILSPIFMRCLKEDDRAYSYFKSLPKSHQTYFSKWIESAKTDSTKTKRITMAVIALGQGQGYPEMMRAHKAQNQF
jgi:hypothetical protein